jgi:branched-chain amino acid transport system substrate-binding protein
MRRRFWVSFVVVIAIATVIVPAAAGSALPKAQNNSDPSEGVTPTSVTVGGVMVASGEAGFSEAGAVIGFKAYVNQINASGGVYGRKINFVGDQDDAYSATTDVQIVQNLVEQKHVFMVAPVASNQFTGGSYLVENNIPFIGSGNGTPFCGTTSGFGFYGCSVPSLTPGSPVSPSLYRIVKDVLKKEGKLKPGQKPSIAVVFNSSGSGPVSVAPAKVEAQLAGFNVSYDEAAIPAVGVADFSPYAEQVLTSNHGGPPDAVFLLSAGSNVVGMHQALVAAGFKGPLFDATTYAPSTTQNSQLVSALQNEYSIIQLQPYQANTPNVRQMLSSMRKIEGKSYVPDNYAEQGYEAAALMVAMLRATGPDLTRGNLLEKVNNGFSFHLQGLFGKLTYPEDHNEGNGCDAAVQLKGSVWKVAQPLVCYPNLPVPEASS